MSQHNTKIDFDRQKKIFRLDTSLGQLTTDSARDYVEARAGQTFRPHVTRICRDIAENIRLVQEISFAWGPQATLRRQLVEFWRVAGHCYKMLEELAEEEGLAAVRGG